MAISVDGSQSHMFSDNLLSVKRTKHCMLEAAIVRSKANVLLLSSVGFGIALGAEFCCEGLAVWSLGPI